MWEFKARNSLFSTAHTRTMWQEGKSNQSERKGPEFDHSSDSSRETGIKDFFFSCKYNLAHYKYLLKINKSLWKHF